MKKTPSCIALLLTMLLFGSAALGAEPTPQPADAEARLAEARKLIEGLKPQSGDIVLRGGIAKVTVPATLRYLSPEDTETVLAKLWGNPKGERSLGMLVPAGFDPFADESWAVVIDFDESGYVKDDDAAKIDYAKLLSQMRDDMKEGNKARKKQGYEAVELVGWATTPRYDAAAKKLYWAKELKFGTASGNTLNYNIRMLGRRGVLVLNAVAGMNQLKTVEAATPALLAAVNFEPGHRYADFNASTDKAASYGIAALVAGGVAAKTGLLKGLWLGILAFKKVIIVGLIALAGSAKKISAWLKGRERTVADVKPADKPADTAPTPPAA